MKTAWKDRKIILAVGLGLAAVGFVSTMTFSTFVDPSNTASQNNASPSELIRTATAATPSKSMHESLAPHIAGGDSRLDDYRLERDSCCIGN